MNTKRLVAALASCVLYHGCREQTELIDSTFDGGGGKEVSVPQPLPLPPYCESIIRPCYNGTAGSLLYGECRPGILRCDVNESPTCFGEVLPKEEACNGLDDDCDGEVDEGLAWELNIVAIVDNSCSMSSKIAGVRGALTDLLNRYAPHPGIKWAVVGAPPTGGNAQELPRLESNFGTVGDALDAVARQDGTTGWGDEPVVDAIGMVVSNAWPLKWTTSNRLLLVFTDEPPQVVYGTTPVQAPWPTLIFTENANWLWFGEQFQLSNSDEMARQIEPRMKKESCK